MVIRADDPSALVKSREAGRDQADLASKALRDIQQLYIEWLDSRRDDLGVDAPETLVAQERFGLFCLHEGRRAEAERLLTECMERRLEHLGEEDPATQASLYQVACLKESLGQWEEAEMLAGWLLEVTPQDSESYEERERLLDRVRAAGGGE